MENIELVNENKQIEPEIIDNQPKSEKLSNIKVIASDELEDSVEYLDRYDNSIHYSFINSSSKTSKCCFNMCKCLRVRSKVRYNDGKGFVNNNSNTCVCETTYYKFSCDCKVCK